jgi:hypothetical protein
VSKETEYGYAWENGFDCGMDKGRKQGALEELEKVKVMFNRLTIGKFLDWLYEEKKELEKKGRCLSNG